MTMRISSRKKAYYAKAVGIAIAISLLILKSEQHFTNPVIILISLLVGFYLGRITCNIHLKSASIGITLLIFILMNVVHSFIDGISFTGQSFLYWLGAICGHEAIRQPTLYVILWAMLHPFAKTNYSKLVICFLSVSGGWLLGICLGMLSGNIVSHVYNMERWIGYVIFLFTGDIAHHLIDQYPMHRKR